MTGWRRFEPLILLFAAGGFVGLIFPLAKLAGQMGLSPLVYAGLSAAGAAIVLHLICLIGGERAPPRQGELAYALVAGQFTFAIPFGTLVAVIPLAGSGVPAILQSLAPLITLAIVYALGAERPSLWRSLGLAIGFAGVLLILFSRGAGEGAEAGKLVWYLIALITPLALAVGNVYRSLAWPPGSKALPLATLTLAAAALGLLLLAWLFHALGFAGALSAGLARGWPLILLQSLVTGIGYAFFFRLQQVGGPVYLSQISYVNTGVGVIFAVAAFGEMLPLTAWFAIPCIFAGIALVTLTGKPEN
jgi:drug/metabolite transporter (DMT)-like permease